MSNVLRFASSCLNFKRREYVLQSNELFSQLRKWNLQKTLHVEAVGKLEIVMATVPLASEGDGFAPLICTFQTKSNQNHHTHHRTFQNISL